MHANSYDESDYTSMLANETPPEDYIAAIVVPTGQV